MIKELLHNKNVAVLVDNMERFDFFKSRVSKYNIKNVFYLHSNVFTYISSKEKNNLLLTCTYLTEERYEQKLSIEEAKYGKIISKKISEKKLISIKEISSSVDFLLVFSGFQYSFNILSESFSDVEKIYFEIGNFPNRFQWNFNGINADADYTSRFKIESNVDTDAIREEINGFVPPHVSKKISSKVLETICDKFGEIFFKTLAPHPSFLNYLLVFLNTIKARKLLTNLKRNSRDLALVDQGYVLFIGQVEQDTQTFFQSDETGISALKKANTYAISNRAKLIVRLHPAEKNYKSLASVIEYCFLNKIEINNFGSLDGAIKKSSEIITINSTGGAHALIFDKHVTTYGRAFYKDWSSYDVLYYVEHILEKY